jgi:hypothetical protein
VDRHAGAAEHRLAAHDVGIADGQAAGAAQVAQRHRDLARGPKHVVKRGKTPVLSDEQARRLLASIQVSKTITSEDGTEKEVPLLTGLRDRALIGVMAYSFGVNNGYY